MKRTGTLNETAAHRAVSFIQTLKHTKGRWAGAPFMLAPWQERDIVRPLFGTLNDDGKRQYRKAYVEVPRKNGKSELAAAIALKLLFSDGEQGAEIYGAACDRDQASIVFNVAAEMVRRSPALSKASRIIDSTKRIIFPKNGSFYRAIPADAAGSHGFNAHGVIFDELHAQPNRELWDVLTTSTGAREQPLIFAITTAGWDRTSICWEQHEYAAKVRAGIVEDPSFFAYIRAAPEEADWQDEKVWKACNPALGDFRSLSEMRDLARQAAEMPALQNTFRQLYLNQWTQQAERAIDMALWDENAGLVVEPDLAGRPCFGGLDLGETSDLCAWLLLFPQGEELDILARFWVPEARLHDSRNHWMRQYRQWKEQGLLMTTPGETVDLKAIGAQVLKDAAQFRLQEIGADPWHMHLLANDLEDHGLKVFKVAQTMAGVAPAFSEMLRRLLNRHLHHGGNPVLRWMADNVAVRKDHAGNMKPDKATSGGKIDGIAAMLNALDRTMRHEEQVSVYDTRGVRFA